MTELARNEENPLSNEHAPPGRGFENEEMDDVALPWFTLLQDLSPQIKKKARIEGAEVGQFCNTLTEEIYDEPEVVFCWFQTQFVEWKPRSEGGGFVGRHDRESKIVQQAKNSGEFPFKTDRGNELMETVYAFLLVLPTEEGQEPEQAVMSVSSTKLSHFKKFRGKLRLKATDPEGRRFQPDLFQHVVRLSSFDDERNGQEFKGVKFEKSRLLGKDDPVYRLAEEFYETASRGAAKVDYEKQETKEDVL